MFNATTIVLNKIPMETYLIGFLYNSRHQRPYYINSINFNILFFKNINQNYRFQKKKKKHLYFCLPIPFKYISNNFFFLYIVNFLI